MLKNLDLEVLIVRQGKPIVGLVVCVAHPDIGLFLFTPLPLQI